MNAFLDGPSYEIQIIKNENNLTLTEVYRTAEKKIRYLEMMVHRRDHSYNYLPCII